MDLAAELSRYGPGALRSAVPLAEAEAYCRRLATAHYENFTVASRLFPRHLYQHLCNVYAYCRWADDLADEAGAACPLAGTKPGPGAPRVEADGTRSVPTTSTALLDWWETQLDAMLAGQATHPVFVALAETHKQFALSREPLADLLAAFRRDQVQTRYETLDDLLTYCQKSANPVGRLVLALGRSQSEQCLRYSDSICTGLQLANFWQDVRRDYERGRIYLPRELRLRHGWDDVRFAAGRMDEDFRNVLKPLVEQTEALLRSGQPLVGLVHPDLRLPVQVFINGGLAILAAIRRARYDVWTRRPTVGRLAKARILLHAWWRR